MILSMQIYAALLKVAFIATILYGMYAFNEAYIIYRIDKVTIQQKQRLSQNKQLIESTAILEETNALWVSNVNKRVITLIIRGIFQVEVPDPISAESIEYLNMTRGDANPMQFRKVDSQPQTPIYITGTRTKFNNNSRIIANELKSDKEPMTVRELEQHILNLGKTN